MNAQKAVKLKSPFKKPLITFVVYFGINEHIAHGFREYFPNFSHRDMIV